MTRCVLCGTDYQELVETPQGDIVCLWCALDVMGLPYPTEEADELPAEAV